MKKVFITILCLLLCFALCGCGSKGNPDHEYILTLLEKGEYDMAIEIIQHLKERENGGVSQPQPSESTSPTVETPAQAPAQLPAEAPTPVGDVDEQVVDLVKRFMEEQGKEQMALYEQLTGGKAEAVSVLHALKYQLSDVDGKKNDVSYLMVDLGGSFAYDNAVFDSIQIVYDSQRDILVSSANIDWNLIGSGEVTSPEQFQHIAANSYRSYLDGTNQVLWTELEEIAQYSSEQIGSINSRLK